jgi:hypothetical protein
MQSLKTRNEIDPKMPLYYKISEELNMILYVGQGVLHPSDFYALERVVLAENHRKPGMITIVDALHVSTSFTWPDVHNFISHLNSMTRLEAGPYIMLTLDRGIHLLAQAANLIIGKPEMKIHVHDTLEDVIRAFGLADHKREIIQFWQECRAEFATQI